GSCGTVAYDHASGTAFPVGDTTVTANATRRDGGTASCSFHVVVNDTQPPALGTPSATPNSLWPPNHTMQDIAISYASSDNCSVACVVSDITSNEPINGTGDGDTAPDWQFVDATHIKVRAERAGNGNGRIYTATVTCTDPANNSTSRTTQVLVAHDKGRK